ncbi:MAG TPA: ABC transporter permease [Chthoniobacterales bacterium]|nr:ABC transporter permease [Chthoniobacterales bacterium]
MNAGSPVSAIETTPAEGSIVRSRLTEPTFRIRPTKGWAALNLRELWQYRDLLWLLVERNIKVIYKQTALGIAWVALQPLIAAAVLALVAGRVAKLPSDGAPHLLFVFCGLAIWNYFSQTAQRSSTSLINNAQLVSKVYFPRMLIPLSHTFSTLVDFAVTLIMLFVLMAFYHVAPSLRLFAIPGFLLLTAITATGVALWFSALSVKYRDTSYALPLFLQIWFWASAIIYPTTMITSPRSQTLFALNPVVGFVEGFRWCVLGKSALNPTMLWITISMSILALLTGAFFFRRVERSFADVI